MAPPKLRAKGYTLVSQWSEHKRGTQQIDRHAVDPKRLSWFTTEDAIGLNIDMIIRNLLTGEERLVDLALLSPHTRLFKIRDEVKAAGLRA